MIIDPEAYDNALRDTAGNMTAELRKDAIDHGWHQDVVNNMRVEYSDEAGFKVKIHPDYHDRAFKHEYGQPGTQPTAVIRKFRNRDTESDKDFIKHLDKHSG